MGQLNVPLPHCKKCGITVPNITLNRNSRGDLIFEVSCHGETDQTIIPRSLLEEGPITLLPGTAFRDGGSNGS